MVTITIQNYYGDDIIEISDLLKSKGYNVIIKD